MKAAVLENYGAPESFKIKEVSTPELKEGEILLRNRASSVNPIDTLVRRGKTRLITGLFGQPIIGSDFSGIIIRSRSKKFKDGDEVFGFLNAVKGGAYAENVVVKEKNTCLKPAGLSFTEAASLPLVASTAWQAMVKDGELAMGDKVLILGCTGGVGTAAVQIAKSFNAEVAGTCSAVHSDFARELGCTMVWDYKKKEIPSEEKFDLIFDASGKYSLSDYKENLAEDAFFVSTRGGADSLSGAADMVTDLAFKSQMKIVMVKPNPEDLEKLKALVEKGQLKAHVAEVFSLDQIADAHRKAENGGFTGKIVVEIP